jgi:hypothetical protein
LFAAGVVTGAGVGAGVSAGAGCSSIYLRASSLSDATIVALFFAECSSIYFLAISPSDAAVAAVQMKKINGNKPITRLMCPLLLLIF